jgi:hypothetical protein
MKLNKIEVLSCWECKKIARVLHESCITNIEVAAALDISPMTYLNYRNRAFSTYQGRMIMTLFWNANPKVRELVEQKESDTGKAL